MGAIKGPTLVSPKTAGGHFMSYPQDPHQASNQPYGQPGQEPYGQTPHDQTPYGQTPYGQPNIGPFAQPENPYGPAPQQPYGQPNIGPFAQPENPFDNSGGQAQQPYGQPGSPYGNVGGVSQQSFEPYGQPQQYGAPPLQPGYPQQQFFGAQPPAGGGKGKGGVIALVVIAVVVALGVGGYLAFGTTNKITPVASPTGEQQNVTPPAGSSTAPGSGAVTGAATSAPAAVVPPAGSFNPPAGYSSNSLSDDDGCGDYASAAGDFLISTVELSGDSDATSALTTLAGALKSAAGDAEDPTLAGALTAEASFVQQNVAALTPPLVDYGTNFEATPFDTAARAIQSTDDYINGVCGTASWIPSD